MTTFEFCVLAVFVFVALFRGSNRGTFLSIVTNNYEVPIEEDDGAEEAPSEPQ